MDTLKIDSGRGLSYVAHVHLARFASGAINMEIVALSKV